MGIRGSITGAGGATLGVSLQLDSNGQAVVQQFIQEIRTLRTETTRELRSLEQTFTRTFGRVQNQATRFGSTFKDVFAANAVWDGVKKLSSLLTNALLGALKMVGNALKGTAEGMLNFGRSIISATDEFRKFTVALEGSLRLQPAIQRALDFSLQFATQTPLRFRDVAESLRSLSAIPQVRPFLLDMENLNANLTTFLRTVEGLTVLRPDQGAKGALFSLREAIGGQFRSFRFRFDIDPEIVAASIGKSLEEIKGNVGETLRAFSTFVSNTVGEDTARKLAQTIEVQMGNISDFFYQLRVNIGQLGITDAATDKLRRFSELLQTFARGSASGGTSQTPEYRMFILRMNSALEESFGAFTRVGEAARRMLNSVLGIEQSAGALDTIQAVASNVAKAFELAAHFANLLANAVDRLSGMSFSQVYNSLHETLIPGRSAVNAALFGGGSGAPGSSSMLTNFGNLAGGAFQSLTGYSASGLANSAMARVRSAAGSFFGGDSLAGILGITESPANPVAGGLAGVYSSGMFNHIVDRLTEMGLIRSGGGLMDNLKIAAGQAVNFGTRRANQEVLDAAPKAIVESAEAMAEAEAEAGVALRTFSNNLSIAGTQARGAFNQLFFGESAQAISRSVQSSLTSAPFKAFQARQEFGKQAGASLGYLESNIAQIEKARTFFQGGKIDNVKGVAEQVFSPETLAAFTGDSARIGSALEKERLRDAKSYLTVLDSALSRERAQLALAKERVSITKQLITANADFQLERSGLTLDQQLSRLQGINQLRIRDEKARREAAATTQASELERAGQRLSLTQQDYNSLQDKLSFASRLSPADRDFVANTNINDLKSRQYSEAATLATMQLIASGSLNPTFIGQTGEGSGKPIPKIGAEDLVRQQSLVKSLEDQIEKYERLSPALAGHSKNLEEFQAVSRKLEEQTAAVTMGEKNLVNARAQAAAVEEQLTAQFDFLKRERTFSRRVSQSVVDQQNLRGDAILQSRLADRAGLGANLRMYRSGLYSNQERLGMLDDIYGAPERGFAFGRRNERFGFEKGFASTFRSAVGSANAAFDEMVSLGQDAAEQLQQAFDDSFFNVFTGKVRDLDDVWKNLLSNMSNLVLQSFSRQATNKLFGSLIGTLLGSGSGNRGTGGASDVADSAISSAESAVNDLIDSVPRAAGGAVFRGPQLAILGDNRSGEEAAIPLEGGAVPVKMMGGSAPPTIIMVKDDAAAQRAAAAAEGRAYIVRVSADNMRRNGVMRKSAQSSL